MAFNISYTFEALDKFSAVSNRINNQLNKISQRVTLLREKFKKTGEAIGGFGRRMSVAVTAPLVGIGIASLKSADDIDILRNRLSTLTSSTAEANKFYKNLIDFTVESPFNLKSVGDAAVTLRTMGFSAKDTFHSLKMLGNISAATGADMGMLAGMFGRARSSSRGVSLMFTTLGQYGVNLRDVLIQMAAEAGHANVDISKMVAAGEVTFPDLLAAINRVAGGTGKFSGQMSKLADTTGALAGSFKTAVQVYMLAPLGETIDSVLNISSKLKDMISYLLKNQDKIKIFFEMHKDAIKAAIIIGAILALLGPMLVILGLIIASVSMLISPWTIIIGVIIAVGTALLKTYLQHHTLMQLLRQIVDIYHSIISTVSNFITQHKLLVEYAKTFLVVMLGIIGAVKVLQVALAVINLLLAPLDLIPLIIVAIIAGAIMLYKHFKWVRDIVKEIGTILYDVFIAPIMKVIHLFERIKGLFGKHATTIAVQKEVIVRGGAAPIGATPIPIRQPQQKVTSNLDISVNDPSGIIRKLSGQSDGDMNLNLGQNMSMSRWVK